MSSHPTFALRCLLGLAVSGFAIGWALWLFARLGSHTGGWLFFHLDMPHPTVGRAERITGSILLVLAILAWVPRWGFAAALIGVLALLDAIMGTLNGGYAFSSLTVPAHGLRIAAPLALACWVAQREGPPPCLATTGLWILRLGTAAVFLAHGTEAFLGHPAFQDYLIGTADRFFGWQLEESHIMPLLWAIGLMDFAVAFAALTGLLCPFLLFGAAWGLITAAARVTTLGWEVSAEILIRLPHFAAPLIIWLALDSRK